MKTLIVDYRQINATGWKCGDLVEDESKNQYYISDAENGKATLEPIAEIDKAKRELAFFSVRLQAN